MSVRTSRVLHEKMMTRHVVEEFKAGNMIQNDAAPTIKHEVFEDYSVALEMTSIYEHIHRTKCLKMKLHHL